jgi:hypothetical protein
MLLGLSDLKINDVLAHTLYLNSDKITGEICVVMKLGKKFATVYQFDKNEMWTNTRLYNYNEVGNLEVAEYVKYNLKNKDKKRIFNIIFGNKDKIYKMIY